MSREIVWRDVWRDVYWRDVWGDVYFVSDRTLPSISVKGGARFSWRELSRRTPRRAPNSGVRFLPGRRSLAYP